MEHINDYVKWRGDITFEDRPFCEIDNLVLCQFSYLDIPKRFTEEPDITITNIVNMMSEEGIPLRKKAADDSDRFRDFISKIARSERFGSLEVHDFEDVIDEDKDVQFSAMTITGHGICAVVFRGTDDTVVAWKEDFMICFTEPKAQKYAAFYLARAIKRYGDAIVLGHSKGGNMALYAASSVNDSVRSRIRHVYCNDGPGFCPEVLDPDALKIIDPITTKIRPEFSIIGGIFEPQISDSYIIKSDGKQFDQHELCSWGIDGTKLLLAQDHDPLSQQIVEGVNSWVGTVGMEGRKEFVDTLFDTILNTGAKTIEDLTAKGEPVIRNVFRKVIIENPDTRAAAANLPDNILFDGAGARAKEKISQDPFYKRVMGSELIKGVITCIAGLAAVLLPDDLIFIACIGILVADTIVQNIYAFTRLKRCYWNFRKEAIHLFLASFLLIVTLLTLFKEGALFVMASGLFALLLLWFCGNTVIRARRYRKHIGIRILLIIMTTQWGGAAIFIMFAPEVTLKWYMIVVGILAIVDGVLRIGIELVSRIRKKRKIKRENSIINGSTSQGGSR